MLIKSEKLALAPAANATVTVDRLNVPVQNLTVVLSSEGRTVGSITYATKVGGSTVAAAGATVAGPGPLFVAAKVSGSEVLPPQTGPAKWKLEFTVTNGSAAAVNLQVVVTAQPLPIFR